MQSLKRQIYFAATISLILFGIAKTDYARGTDLMTETVDRTESGNEERDRVDSMPASSEQDNVDRLLYAAITSRIGTPYRSGGTDDSGYDCSGFVWRIFQEAGINFSRSSARIYWETLPEATEEERTQFGTLVFFDNSRHVGVVRDAYSFYHASSSKGVTRSNFSDYWGGHIIGYRRIRLPQDISMVR